MNKPGTVPNALRQWQPIVAARAQQYNLDPVIVLTQIWKESEQDLNNPRLTREEPRYQYFWHPTAGALWESRLSIAHNRAKALEMLGEVEFYFQSRSSGLMQVMGAVAREYGYDGPPEGMFDPDTNINFGCLYLHRCVARSHGDYRHALILYNGSPYYADEILRRAQFVGGA